MQTVWSGFPRFIEEYRNGSTEVDYAAKNYVALKDAFRRYAMELKDMPMEEKDGRRIRGQ
jgi:hypothetical protein